MVLKSGLKKLSDVGATGPKSTWMMCCIVFNLDQRSSPFGLSNYEAIADERSVTSSTGGLSHGFNSPGPPGGPSSVLAGGPPPSGLTTGPPTGLTASPGGPPASWQPVAATPPASSVAVSHGYENRLSSNMQVTLTHSPPA